MYFSFSKKELMGKGNVCGTSIGSIGSTDGSPKLKYPILTFKHNYHKIQEPTLNLTLFCETC
jgi:hypothetical protein